MTDNFPLMQSPKPSPLNRLNKRQPELLAIVDSDPSRRSSTAQILDQAGYIAIESSNITSVLQNLERNETDLVLIDASVEELEKSLSDLRTLDPVVPILLLHPLITEESFPALAQLDIDGYWDPTTDSANLLLAIAFALKGKRRWESTRQAEQQANPSRDVELREFLLADFCDELRSAIHVIRGYSELLGKGEAELSLRIVEAAHETESLTGRYLDLIQLGSSGLLYLRKEIVRLDELLEELGDLGRRSNGRGRVRVEIDFPTTDMVLLTDGEKLRTALSELLGNALRSSDHETILLSVKQGSGSTEFSVRDECFSSETASLSGLPQEPAEMTTKPGCGLGLAIAARLGTVLGAKLSANRDDKGGAMITFSLPTAAQYASSEQQSLH